MRGGRVLLPVVALGRAQVCHIVFHSYLRCRVAALDLTAVNGSVIKTAKQLVNRSVVQLLELRLCFGHPDFCSSSEGIDRRLMLPRLVCVTVLETLQEVLLILEECWNNSPELQNVPIYQASGLARRAISVYQTYIEMMNDDIKAAFQVCNLKRMPTISLLASSAIPSYTFGVKQHRSARKLSSACT